MKTIKVEVTMGKKEAFEAYLKDTKKRLKHFMKNEFRFIPCPNFDQFTKKEKQISYPTIKAFEAKE